LFLPLAGLSSAAFLLILLGCVSADQPPTSPETPEPVPSDRLKNAKRPASEDALIHATLAAKDPSEAKDGYRSLFKLVGKDGLARLQTHTSDTIAIQAAWMQVELTVPVKEPERVVRPDREKLAWFLGFLEKRARVTPPKWWADAILDARANRRGNIYAGGLSIAWLDRKADDPIFKKLPAKATIERREGKLVVQLGKESASLPDDFLEKVQKQKGIHDEVRALFTTTRCYVAMHDDCGYSYRIGCVERSPLKVRWVSDVWGSWWYASTGAGHHWVEIVEQGDRIVVFGVSSIGFNVEAFRADDGVNLFRFSNSYTP
jgi:hypothetical protein